MRLPLRHTVVITRSETMIEVDDDETGLSIELEPHYAAYLDGDDSSTEAVEFWNKLDELGMIEHGLDVRAVRKVQRQGFYAMRPPAVDRLRERLADICEHVPFYERNAGRYDPSLINSMDDIRRLPLMRKSDIRENFPSGLVPKGTDVAAGVESGELVIFQTSGTSADRMQVIAYAALADRHPFGCDDMFGIKLGKESPRTAFFTTPVCAGGMCHMGNSTFEERLSNVCPDLILNSLEDPFGVTKEMVEGFCEEVDRFKPHILMADAIYLQCLIRKAHEFNIPLPRVPLVEWSFEYCPLTSIRDVRREFGVNVLSTYVATEENRLAHECHRGQLHVRTDAVVFEILNSAGECPPNTVGAVALTNYESLTPLVRYLIGDAASWTGVTCDCEFAAWPTIEMHGRLKDMMRSRGRWVTTRDIDKAVGAPDWLSTYQVNQLRSDLFEVAVRPSAGYSPDLKDMAERLSVYIDPKEMQFKVVDRFKPLPSYKIGVTTNRVGGTPEIPDA